MAQYHSRHVHVDTQYCQFAKLDFIWPCVCVSIVPEQVAHMRQSKLAATMACFGRPAAWSFASAVPADTLLTPALAAAEWPEWHLASKTCLLGLSCTPTLHIHVCYLLHFVPNNNRTDCSSSPQKFAADGQSQPPQGSTGTASKKHAERNHTCDRSMRTHGVLPGGDAFLFTVSCYSVVTSPRSDAQQNTDWHLQF